MSQSPAVSEDSGAPFDLLSCRSDDGCDDRKAQGSPKAISDEAGRCPSECTPRKSVCRNFCRLRDSKEEVVPRGTPGSKIILGIQGALCVGLTIESVEAECTSKVSAVGTLSGNMVSSIQGALCEGATIRSAEAECTDKA